MREKGKKIKRKEREIKINRWRNILRIKNRENRIDRGRLLGVGYVLDKFNRLKK